MRLHNGVLCSGPWQVDAGAGHTCLRGPGPRDQGYSRCNRKRLWEYRPAQHLGSPTSLNTISGKSRTSLLGPNVPKSQWGLNANVQADVLFRHSHIWLSLTRLKLPPTPHHLLPTPTDTELLLRHWVVF